jgi:hypothetical protein
MIYQLAITAVSVTGPSKLSHHKLTIGEFCLPRWRRLDYQSIQLREPFKATQYKIFTAVILSNIINLTEINKRSGKF